MPDVDVSNIRCSYEQNNEGIVTVIYGGPWGVLFTAATVIEGNVQGMGLGRAVSDAGDVNGDGYSDVIVGSLLYSNGQQWEGAGFVYHGGAGSAGLLAADPVAERGMETIPSVSVKAFPNPVVNNLSVQLQGLDIHNPTYVEIMNAQGLLLQTIKVGSIEKGNQSIDVSKLVPGLYFIVVRNGSKVFREKVIKQ